MREKLEQSKEFIEEVELLKSYCAWLYGALDEAWRHSSKFETLCEFLFRTPLEDSGINQNIFAKIWTGEIELVEKKPKYVIWTKGSMGENSAVFLYNNTMHDYISSAITRKSEAKNDERYNFDENFAFTLRDTGEFKIEEVVE